MNITTITLTEPKYSIVLTLNKIIIKSLDRGVYPPLSK